MKFLRPLMLMFAAFALLLAVTPESGVHAAGMEMGATIASAHDAADGCANAAGSADQTDKHGGCAKMLCCLGNACVFAGLPATMVVGKSLSAGGIPLSASTTPLTGRDVAPPLDPPRSFV